VWLVFVIHDDVSSTTDSLVGAPSMYKSCTQVCCNCTGTITSTLIKLVPQFQDLIIKSRKTQTKLELNCSEGIFQCSCRILNLFEQVITYNL